MVEYSKNLFTCKVLDGQVIYGSYRVVDGVIYFHDHIYLTRYSKLKEGILHATYEALFSGNEDSIGPISPSWRDSIGRISKMMRTNISRDM